MKWLPVNNAQWALLGSGRSIAPNQLAMILKICFLQFNWVSFLEEHMIICVYCVFSFRKDFFFFSPSHFTTGEGWIYTGVIWLWCVHKSSGFHNWMYYLRMFSQWRPDTLWIWACIWYTQRSNFLGEETYDGVSFLKWESSIQWRKKTNTGDREYITFSRKWPFLWWSLWLWVFAFKNVRFGKCREGL